MANLSAKAKRRKEFLLYVITAAVPILDVAAVGLGLDIKYVWIPSLVLLLWPIYLLTEKFPEENHELSFLQSVRATIYFFQLLFLIPANGLVIGSFNPEALSFTVPIAAASFVIDLGISRSHRDEVALFDKDQKRLFLTMTWKAGLAPIWLSVAVILADLIIRMGPGLFWIGIPFALAFAYMAYRREKVSAKSAHELADSLKESKWHRRLDLAKKRRRKFPKR